MTTDILHNLRRFSLNIVIVQILALLALVIAVVAMNSYMKHEVAEQMLLAAQNDFLTGDFRQAILRMESANKHHFTAVGYFKHGRRIFNIPSNIDSSLFNQKNLLRVMQNARVVKTISFGNSNVESLGELNFIYDRFELLPYGFMLWGLLLSLTFPIWFRARNRLIRDYSKEMVFQEQKSKAQIADQVAHDIKSPLAALSVLQQDLQELPEEKRLLLRSAVQRIHDIANDLSKKKTPDKNISDTQATSNNQVQDSHENLSTQLLSSLIDTLVSEKRLQFRSKINVEIEANQGQESYGLFAKIKTVEFKRLLSNLINNAVEAFEPSGRVLVGMSHCENQIRITVADNGKGIPPEILPKLMCRGETHGKSGGSGLGLFHAKTALQSWGGNLQLASEMGTGTTVTVALPKEPAPPWFVPELKIENSSTVVIVDDDNSIHQIWRGRLEKFVKEQNITVKHFSTPDELLSWCQNCEKDFQNEYKIEKDISAPSDARRQTSCEHLLILCDYEFLGHNKTGLDLIEELGLATNTILVTSHFEESQIRERCQKLGVQLIPKNLAGFVPMRAGCWTVDGERQAQSDPPSVTDVARVSSDQMLHKDNPSDISLASPVQRIPSTVERPPSDVRRKTSDAPHAILIDDDMLVHMNWKMAAKKKNKILYTFIGPNEFQIDVTDLDKSTPIYVDSNLSDGIKGEDVTKALQESGFTNLYLATGFDKSNFPDMPWIQDVVGKNPPW